MFFDLRHFLVGEGGVSGLDHRVDEVKFGFAEHAGFHRTAGNEDGGDVQTHRGDEHTRGHFVTVADADEGIGFVGIDHIFDAVGDNVAGGQGVEHPVVAHRDTVVNGDGVKFSSVATEFFNFGFDNLAGFVQVGVTGHELGERVRNRDDGFAHLFAFHSIGNPQSAGSRHSAALERNTAS